MRPRAKTTRTLLLVGLLCGLASPAGAQEEPIGYAPGVAPTLHGKLALSLADAIKMGLENNLDVEVERHEPFIAREDVTVAWGAYDPEFFSEISYTETREPTANALVAGPTDPTGTVRPAINKTVDEPSGSGGFRGIVPILGSEYSLQLSGSERTTETAFEAISPQLDSSFSLNFTQPLLKDLVWNQEWTTVRNNKIVAARSLETFRTSVMDVVETIEKAYWDLVANGDSVRVAEKSLETAQALLDQTQTQYEVGVVSKVEVVEGEAGVAEREFDLIIEVNDLRNSQDRLIDAVLGAGLRAESSLEILPTDRPDDYIPYEINVPAAVAKALSLRPELAEARREIERQQIQLKFRRNQVLPQVDFFVDFSMSGIAGDPNSDFQIGGAGPIADFSPSDFGGTFDGYDESETFTVGGRFSMPLPNRSARSNATKTELELRRAMTRRLRIEQNIVLEVRERARNLEASQEGIEAAERRRLAAAEQLRAERIRLEYGESTPFDVLLREEDLVEAENQKIGALQAYRDSVTELDRAQGTILSNRNIRLEDVSALRLDVR